MTLHIFTSAALNYLPKVSRLVQSVRVHHPEARITLALSDRLPAGAARPEGFDQIISVDDLGLTNVAGWTFGHSLVELATAIKPFVLERLLAGPQDRVLYLDPDTVLFDRLDDVLAALETHSVALTPHLVGPETTDQGIRDNEMAALRHGIYNLGFVAVRGDGEGCRFARWWRYRCERWCIDDIANGLFTDQRWVDLVPALFARVAILRTPRLNVAPWNISQRPVSRREGQYWIGAERLGFYHFTGFDSGAHAVMAERYGQSSGAVAELIHDYRGFLRAAARDPLCLTPWAFARFENGDPIPMAARRLYRARTDLHEAFPNPYQEGFRQWWLAHGVSQPIPASVQLSGRARLAESLRRPASWGGLARRALRVWRSEGAQGLVRRLRS